jgi:hypothetical protein
MYKTLCVAIFLLPTFAVAQEGAPASSPASAITSPVIVAKRKAPHQTAAIPTTTLFTPTEDGLYRISAYATLTKVGTANSGSWTFSLGWTDDAGPQTEQFVLDGSFNARGPFLNDYNFYGGAVRTFEAKGGTPITYNLDEDGVSDGSEYSLYYTLEQLE